MSALPAGEAIPGSEHDLYRTLYVANAMVRSAVEIDELAKDSLVESLNFDNGAMVKSSISELMATCVERSRANREAVQFVRREYDI
jgi:hypothetical protein